MSFYEKSGSKAAGGTHRRTWDTTEYSIKANERAVKEQEEAEARSGKKSKKPKLPDGIKAPPPKKLLEARKEAFFLRIPVFEVDLESRIGKQVVINKTAGASDASGGYHCDICDCTIKDSINYLDHINGNGNMGYSMRIKRSTIDDIKAKLAEKREKQEVDKRKKDDDIEEELREEEAKMADWKRQKRDQKSRKRAAPRDDADEEDETVALDPADDELYQMMGLSGFGGSKKNN
ncbi:Zinc finger matrin-type protein 2 [Aphelenchoides fujianensis]|nr:Zinc finger matrin-type protein 2 [Aphelenchoides fujianensis]